MGKYSTLCALPRIIINNNFFVTWKDCCKAIIMKFVQTIVLLYIF